MMRAGTTGSNVSLIFCPLLFRVVCVYVHAQTFKTRGKGKDEGGGRREAEQGAGKQNLCEERK